MIELRAVRCIEHRNLRQLPPTWLHALLAGGSSLKNQSAHENYNPNEYSADDNPTVALTLDSLLSVGRAAVFWGKLSSISNEASYRQPS